MVLAAWVVMLGVAWFIWGANPGIFASLPTRTLVLGASSAVEVRVKVADTEAERDLGLMGRPADSLAEDAGMLFVFEEEQDRSFWMKDTRIPLSVAYIDKSGRVVDLQDMDPLDASLHTSSEPAMYALEVNRGFFEERGLEVGDRIISGLEPARPQPSERKARR